MSAKTADFDLREFVLDAIRPLLPKHWKLLSTGAVDTPTQPTVELTLTTIERGAQAPQSHRLVSYDLTVIEPNTTPKAGEQAIDNDISILLNALDDVPTFAWTRAQRGNWPANDPIYNAFVITLQILVQKEN